MMKRLDTSSSLQQNCTKDQERLAFVKQLAISVDPLRALDHRITPSFISLRKKESPLGSDNDKINENNLTKRSRVQEITQYSESFKNKLNLRSEVLGGIPCCLWGFWEDTPVSLSSGSLIILLQGSQQDFNFVKRFQNVSILNTKWLLVDKINWRSSLHDVLLVILLFSRLFLRFQFH